MSQTMTVSPSQPAKTYDLVIIGSGAASVTAALAAKSAGKSALIVEKTGLFGGTTATSGGTLWVPNNPLMKRAGLPDSYELARTYLDACVGPHAPGSTAARRHAFLTEGPKAIELLQTYGMQFDLAPGYSDYHVDEVPGGMAQTRSIIPRMFDLRRLGDWRERLRRRPAPPIRANEIPPLTLNGRTLESRMIMLKVALRMTRQWLGGDLTGMGAALQGRLLEIALREQIPILLDTEVTGWVMEGGRVAGVLARRDGNEMEIRARDGVIANAGGFSHNDEMRSRFMRAPTSRQWTLASPGDTGEVMQLAIAAGAATACMEQAWWSSISILPDGSLASHPMDISKPHCLMVDQTGVRYTNESTSYVAVGNAMYARNSVSPAIPSWLISDSRHRTRYRWGGRPPGKPPREWLASGYMLQADTLDELATQCGIDPRVLRENVERFNGFARRGRDEDFGRGIGAFNHRCGDVTVRPNPNLGTVEAPPFYAVKLYPGDVGTSGGLVCDEFARVLNESGEPLPGLYATGNISASVMGRSYTGGGGSIAAAVVFGYIAARHATHQT